ncbi:MAG: DUF2807 domain-containing protein, partial [Rhizomicrobium sp.]
MNAARILAAAFAGGLVATAAVAQTTVPLANFDSIELRGGGHVVLSHGPQQQVTILKGSTQYTRFEMRDSHKLVIDACNSDCPANYDLEVEIVTPDIHAVAISGGGAIESAPGFPAQGSIAAAVDGGGKIDIRNVEAQNGTAAVNGGGHIEIRANGHLTAAVNGGGKIGYVGNPQVAT